MCVIAKKSITSMCLKPIIQHLRQMSPS
uniref:Uncharacterized protein n=1 Tax=Anguilla anguilla TaxID=7936 RepID=A0A0E9QK23_ANGAN